MQDIDSVLDQRAVRAVYQPLVDLASGEVLGFEALARGPEESPWERPDLLFAAAREVGRVAELDWICRAEAVRGALAAGLRPELALFVNVEPDSLGFPCPSDLVDVLEAGRALRVVCELTERRLARSPAALLAAVAQIRAQGWGIALDDVGAEPASLALMPLVHPDVIKLDMELVRERPDPAASRTVAAVMAQAESSGARVLAEGIEEPQHVARALALGATIGQGWMFGRPGQLPRSFAAPRRPVVSLPPIPSATANTPYECGHALPQVPQTTTKAMLLPLSKHLESRATEDRDPPIVLATFQHEKHFTALTGARYREYAARSPLVAAVGVGLPPSPAPGVRGAAIDPGDPVRHEWDVIVLGPHYAAALLARDLGDEDRADGDRRFSFVLTHDREVVLAAARSLLARVVPLSLEAALDGLPAQHEQAQRVTPGGAPDRPWLA